MNREKQIEHYNLRVKRQKQIDQIYKKIQEEEVNISAIQMYIEGFKNNEAENYRPMVKQNFSIEMIKQEMIKLEKSVFEKRLHMIFLKKLNKI